MDACADFLYVLLTKVSHGMKGDLPDTCIGCPDLQCDALSLLEYNAATAAVTFSIFCDLHQPLWRRMFHGILKKFALVTSI